MNNAEEILVIILSVTLAIFLVLGIIVLRKVSKVLDHVNNITAKAESIMEQAGQVTDYVQKAVKPIAAGKIITSIISAITQHKDKKETTDEKN